MAAEALRGEYQCEQLVILVVLTMDAEGIRPTVSELAKLTGLAKSSISRHINRLMTDGYLEETIDRDDRRRRLLGVTAKGRQGQRQHERVLRRFLDQRAKTQDGPLVQLASRLAGS